MSRKILLAIIIVALVIAAGAMSLYHWQSLRSVESETTTENGDFKTYTNKEYGFSFEYPKGWGEVHITPELKGFDTGSLVSIYFDLNSEPRVWINLFSDDFTEGIYEGTPAFYTPSELKNNRDVLYNKLGFVSHEETHINGKVATIGIGDRGYGAPLAASSYLLPEYLNNLKVRNVFASLEMETRPEKYTREELVALRQKPINKQFEVQLIRVLESLSDIK